MYLNSLRESLHFFLTIFAELSLLFVGVSFLVALLQEHLPESTIKRLLAAKGGRGNTLEALLGSATPFCSCSTIPIMVGLTNSGAPFGSAVSFLVASPLLNPVIISLFVAFFGWRVAAVYSALCFILAVLSGLLWEKMGLSSQVKRVRVTGGNHETPGTATGVRSSLQRAFSTAVAQFRDALPFLIAGVVVGAAIYGFVPTDWVTRVAGSNSPLAIPIAAVIGVPLYIRTETMIPIGMVLMQKGMSLGALMALIIGGAGASIPEISLLASIFKPRLVMAFVITILIVAVTVGFTLGTVA
ncbi:MAG: permease [Ignavibacteriales bacterium]